MATKKKIEEVKVSGTLERDPSLGELVKSESLEEFYEAKEEVKEEVKVESKPESKSFITKFGTVRTDN